MKQITKYALSGIVFVSGAFTGYNNYELIQTVANKSLDRFSLRSDTQVLEDIARDNPRVQNALTLTRLVYETN